MQSLPLNLKVNASYKCRDISILVYNGNPVIQMKTYLPKKGEVERKWWLIDAEGQVLGRLCSKIASILKGKTKPEYTPNIDAGDFVIVINAEKVKVSGRKERGHVYYRHSMISGGLKSESLEHLRKRYPEKIIEYTVKNMLPRTTLGEKQLTKLKVYRGQAHPHQSQKPQKVGI